MATDLPPIADTVYATLTSRLAGRSEAAKRAAMSQAKPVATWYATQRPGRAITMADRDDYVKWRTATKPEKTALNEWGVVRVYLNGGRPTRSNAGNRARSATTNPVERKAHIAAVAETARAIREPASTQPVRHLKLVESPKPLVKTERDALVDLLLDIHERIVDVRAAIGEKYLVATPRAPRRYADLAQRLGISQVNAAKALRILQPASAMETPATLQPDEPQAHGVPVDPAFLAAHEGRPVSSLAIYAAVWSGIGLNGAVYDYRLGDARAALTARGMGHMDAWRSRGQFLGALFMRHALVEDITDRVTSTWGLCELHLFLWACREHCCGYQIDAATAITQGGPADKTVHDVIARIDGNIGMFEETMKEADYVRTLEPDALAHFERVRAQYAAFWETEK